MSKVCAVTGCGTSARSGHLMCRAHWIHTPKALRDEVWRTWRIVEASKGLSDRRQAVQRLREIRAYRDAVDAAVAWWNGR